MIELPEFHEVSYAADGDARTAMLKMTRAERQRKAEDILVRYPRFQAAYAQVYGLHKQGPEGAPILGEIVGFLGNSRAGKSWLLQAMLRDALLEQQRSDQDKAERGEATSGLVVPMAYIEVKDRWGAPDMATALYIATGATSVPYIAGKSLELKCVRRVATMQTEFIIVDDAHYIFDAPPAKRKGMLSLIKSLADSRKCTVLLAGLNSIEAGMQDHRQHFNRGGFPAANLVEHDTTLQD